MQNKASLPETTYEISFYDRHGGIDSVQQHTEEALARSIIQMFNEPDSADLYSRITLTAHDWRTGADTELASLIFA